MTSTRDVLQIPELKSVILIGGCGFLGLHLIEEFWRVEPRPEIHVFDIRALPPISKTFYSFDPEQITVHVGDITSPKDISDALAIAKPQVVVHSVSPVHGLGQSIYHKVNVEGTLNIIEQAKADPNVRALVYTSSAGVVFNGDDVRNVNESCPIPEVAMDAYNETKGIAEGHVLKAADNFTGKDAKGKLLTIALRPAGIFGPGDRQMIPNLRAIAFRGQHKFQLGNNLNLFDLTYAGNVAYSHALAAQKLLDPKYTASINGEAFFITNDSPIYFWSMARAVWKADGFTDEAKFVIPRELGIFFGYISEFISKLTGKEPGLTPFRVRTTCADKYYDISKAKVLLQYRPQTDLQEGIEQTLKWLDEIEAEKKEKKIQ